jgi:chromosome partitioning protein
LLDYNITTTQEAAMKTLAIVSQKGGCGKTTLAVHLAAYARQQRLHPAIVDLDPQGSAYKWNARRTENDPQSPRLDAIQSDADKLATLQKIGRENRVDLLILDTAPHANKAAALAIQSADAVLIPCRPATFDLDAMLSTLEIVRASGKPAAIVLNAARRSKRKIAEARAALEAIDALILQTVMHDWVALEDALIDGRAVHEYDPQGKAAEEVALLYRDITMLLDRKQPKEKAA